VNRVRTLGGAVALAGVALLAAPAAWAADTTTPSPSVTPSPTAGSPSASVAPLDAPPVAALPRAVAFRSTVSTRVTAQGQGVTVSGVGCARVHVVVDGPPVGWDDVPPRYFDRTVSATGGSWHTAFRMPAVASTVDATCLDAGSTDSTVVTVAPAANPGQKGLVRRAGGGLLSLQLVVVDQPQPAVELFTEHGKPVPYTVDPTGALLFRTPAGAVSVTAIGWHQFDENAGARNFGKTVSFTAQLPAAATPTPTPSPTATSTSGGLAPSGGSGSLVLVGLLLLAGGAALALRRPS